MGLLRVKEAHVQFGKDGVPTVLPAGKLVDSSSPLVKGREHLFEAADDAARVERPTSFTAIATETADATPGTARARTSPPAKKAALAKVEADAKAETPKAPAKPESKDATEGSKG